MLPGDELVADYLARAGRAAAAALPPADCATVVEEVGRRVRAQVGAPPRWDLHGTEQRLADLGEAEEVVAAVGRELFPDAFAEPEPEPEPEPVPEAKTETKPQTSLPPIPPTESPTDNPTLDLSAMARPFVPAQAEARVSQRAGAGPSPGPPPAPSRGSGRPLFRDEEPPRVRPLGPDESAARDSVSALNRLGWELVALAVLGLAVFPFGYLGWLLGALLITRSRYWEISDKVRVLIGMPTAALGLAVLWAWLRSTQIQESNDSGTRLSEAGDSLLRALEVIPQLCGLLGALYLGYALMRDHHTR
jgi:hypothetical protein